MLPKRPNSVHNDATRLHHLAIRNLANIRTWGPHAILFSGHNPTMERGVTDNALAAATRPSQYTALEFTVCTVAENGSDQLPDAKPFQAAAPVAEFRFPETIHAWEPVSFQCVSQATKSEIGERLWDFGDGIPEVTPAPKHTFEKPGKHRVTFASVLPPAVGANTIRCLPSRIWGMTASWNGRSSRHPRLFTM